MSHTSHNTGHAVDLPLTTPDVSLPGQQEWWLSARSPEGGLRFNSGPE